PEHPGVNALVKKVSRMLKGRADGAERLSRKQRAMPGDEYLAGIANDFQAELRAEIVEHVGGEKNLRIIHKEVLDIVKLCDIGCLYAYRDMEAKGCLDEKTGGLRPIIHDALKLKAFKIQALKAIGLDRVAVKSVWDALYDNPPTLGPAASGFPA